MQLPCNYEPQAPVVAVAHPPVRMSDPVTCTSGCGCGGSQPWLRSSGQSQPKPTRPNTSPNSSSTGKKKQRRSWGLTTLKLTPRPVPLRWCQRCLKPFVLRRPWSRRVHKRDTRNPARTTCLLVHPLRRVAALRSSDTSLHRPALQPHGRGHPTLDGLVAVARRH